MITVTCECDFCESQKPAKSAEPGNPDEFGVPISTQRFHGTIPEKWGFIILRSENMVALVCNDCQKKLRTIIENGFTE